MSKKEKVTQNEREKNMPEEKRSPEEAITQDSGTQLEMVQDNFAVIADLEKQLADALSQVAEYKDGWQRSVADFQNYRRRTEAEKAETFQNAIGSIIKRYLPILDDLERALSTRPADLSWVDGIELIYRKLKSILEAEGLKRIDAEGQMFDPNFHEAIMMAPSDDHMSGQVIEVMQNGYILGERVIRPAQVRVAQ